LTPTGEAVIARQRAEKLAVAQAQRAASVSQQNTLFGQYYPALAKIQAEKEARESKEGREDVAAAENKRRWEYEQGESAGRWGVEQEAKAEQARALAKYRLGEQDWRQTQAGETARRWDIEQEGRAAERAAEHGYIDEESGEYVPGYRAQERGEERDWRQTQAGWRREDVDYRRGRDERTDAQKLAEFFWKRGMLPDGTPLPENMPESPSLREKKALATHEAGLKPEKPEKPPKPVDVDKIQRLLLDLQKERGAILATDYPDAETQQAELDRVEQLIAYNLQRLAFANVSPEEQRATMAEALAKQKKDAETQKMIAAAKARQALAISGADYGIPFTPLEGFLPPNLPFGVNNTLEQKTSKEARKRVPKVPGLGIPLY